MEWVDVEVEFVGEVEEWFGEVVEFLIGVEWVVYLGQVQFLVELLQLRLQ